MVDMDVGTVQRDKDEPMFYGWPGFSMPLEVQFFGSYFNRQYNKLVPFLSALVLGLLVHVHTCGLCVENLGLRSGYCNLVQYLISLAKYSHIFTS